MDTSAFSGTVAVSTGAAALVAGPIARRPIGCNAITLAVTVAANTTNTSNPILTIFAGTTPSSDQFYAQISFTADYWGACEGDVNQRAAELDRERISVNRSIIKALQFNTNCIALASGSAAFLRYCTS
ncbi:exported protein of unknown function [Candidatus Filomicrobium marinum]|nr:exported protein of unknown function [Candidatus Filomicrobium marinum]